MGPQEQREILPTKHQHFNRWESSSDLQLREINLQGPPCASQGEWHLWLLFMILHTDLNYLAHNTSKRPCMLLNQRRKKNEGVAHRWAVIHLNLTGRNDWLFLSRQTTTSLSITKFLGILIVKARKQYEELLVQLRVPCSNKQDETIPRIQQNRCEADRWADSKQYLSTAGTQVKSRWVHWVASTNFAFHVYPATTSPIVTSHPLRPSTQTITNPWRGIVPRNPCTPKHPGLLPYIKATVPTKSEKASQRRKNPLPYLLPVEAVRILLAVYLHAERTILSLKSRKLKLGLSRTSPGFPQPVTNRKTVYIVWRIRIQIVQRSTELSTLKQRVILFPKRVGEPMFLMKWPNYLVEVDLARIAQGDMFGVLLASVIPHMPPTRPAVTPSVSWALDFPRNAGIATAPTNSSAPRDESHNARTQVSTTQRPPKENSEHPHPS